MAGTTRLENCSTIQINPPRVDAGRRTPETGVSPRRSARAVADPDGTVGHPCPEDGGCDVGERAHERTGGGACGQSGSVQSSRSEGSSTHRRYYKRRTSRRRGRRTRGRSLRVRPRASGGAAPVRPGVEPQGAASVECPRPRRVTPPAGPTRGRGPNRRKAATPPVRPRPRSRPPRARPRGRRRSSPRSTWRGRRAETP